MDLKRADLLLAAIAAGDAIGVTSDGCTEAEALAVLALHRDRGWPRRAVGTDELGAGRTSPLTAQARALYRAWLLAGGRFDGDLLARELVAFGRDNRRPLEPSLHRALADLDAGVVWWRGGERCCRERDPGAPGSCDAVARAIPIAALARSDDEALAAARLQAITTDWTSATVEAAAAMVWLLRRAGAGEQPWNGPWRELAAAAGFAGGEPLQPWPLDVWRREVASTAGAALEAERDSAPFRAVELAARAARFAAGTEPLPQELCHHADLLRPCGGLHAFGIVAALGGRACANTACAAALLAVAYGSAPTVD